MYDNFYIDDFAYDNGAGKDAKKAKKAQKKTDRKAKNAEKGGTWLSRTVDSIKKVADGTKAVSGTVSDVTGLFVKSDDTTVSTPTDFGIVDLKAEQKFLGMPKTIGIMVTALFALILLAVVFYFIFHKK